jgi:hypothetical protein
MTAVGFARPSVCELSIRVFRKRLHPELMEDLASAKISSPHFSADVHLCSSGHWLTIESERSHTSEAISSRLQVMPRQHRELDLVLRGGRTQSVCFDGLQYCVAFQVEQLPPDVFVELSDELALDRHHADLFRSYGGSSRLTPPALSVVKYELVGPSLSLHAFHTFPEERIILRTQSLIELA